MSVTISSLSNYIGRKAIVTLYSPTGNTIPYTNATQINLGLQILPFDYTALDTINEYGHFSVLFTGYNHTCVVKQQTPEDGDGNKYNVIKIGTQTWMSENLRTTKYQDGTPLSNLSEVNNSSWINATSSNKYWAYVNGSPLNTETYGLLYNQYAVTGSTIGSSPSNNLCPVGYHVPTNAEFSTLNTFLGVNAGTQMKSNSLWDSGGSGTNTSGFNGVPSGYRDIFSGNYVSFSIFESFWSTNATKDWRLYYFNSLFNTDTSNVRYGFSVRCLKN